MTLLAKKELAKMASFVMLALNLLMNVLHTFEVAQTGAVRVMSGIIAVGLLVALAAWFGFDRRLKRSDPAR